MVTDQIYVNQDGKGMKEALELAERFAAYYSLKPKEQIHLRLLSEETMSLVAAITGEFKALFWLEGTKDQCRVNLEFKTDMDAEKRKEFLSVSTSGKNEAARGILGKIREVIEIGILDYEEADQMMMEYGGDPYNYWAMGIDPQTAVSQSMLTWSLNNYRQSVGEWSDENGAEEEARDELEKSIIANIADDVRVSIRQDKVLMTILKEFGR